MNEIILNFDGVEGRQQLHLFLKRSLSLPDYYGENLDALWDLLGGWVETPVRIRLQGVDDLRKHLGDYADQLVSLFRQASTEITGIEVVVN